MEKVEIQGLISRLENDKAKHEAKFSGQPQHDSCLAKIAERVRDLEAQIEPASATVSSTSCVAKTNGSSCEGDLTVRGDEFEKVDQLQDTAEKLEGQNKEHEADAVKLQMRGMVAKQLNELDGFDR